MICRNRHTIILEPILTSWEFAVVLLMILIEALVPNGKLLNPDSSKRLLLHLVLCLACVDPLVFRARRTDGIENQDTWLASSRTLL